MLYIRPVYTIYPDGREQLTSLAVCSTNQTILVDEQIREHFPPNTSGKDIATFYPSARWGNTLSNEVHHVYA